MNYPKNVEIRKGQIVRRKILRIVGFRISKRKEEYTIWRFFDSVRLCQDNSGTIVWLEVRGESKPIAEFEKIAQDDKIPTIRKAVVNRRKTIMTWTQQMEKFSKYQRISLW